VRSVCALVRLLADLSAAARARALIGLAGRAVCARRPVRRLSFTFCHFRSQELISLAGFRGAASCDSDNNNNNNNNNTKTDTEKARPAATCQASGRPAALLL